jgi:hypothetical protein
VYTPLLHSDNDGDAAGLGLGLNIPLGPFLATVGGKGVYTRNSQTGGLGAEADPKVGVMLACFAGNADRMGRRGFRPGPEYSAGAVPRDRGR